MHLVLDGGPQASHYKTRLCKQATHFTGSFQTIRKISGLLVIALSTVLVVVHYLRMPLCIVFTQVDVCSLCCKRGRGARGDRVWVLPLCTCDMADLEIGIGRSRYFEGNLQNKC